MSNILRFPSAFVTLGVILAGLILCGSTELSATEPVANARPGIKEMRLVTDVAAITPGEPFTLALVVDPLPGHHTYWRGPGIVGMATTLDWNLPEGFSAGDISWPPPQKVLMAGITAYGYSSRTLLLTEIRPPASIVSTDVTLRAKASWMACAKACNPGQEELSITLPVSQGNKVPTRDARLSAAFEQVRQAVPRPAPAAWTITPRAPAADRIDLDLSIPGLAASSAATVYFYCYDKQVDSAKPQLVKWTGESTLRLTLVRPNCAPRSPATISGVLYCPDGWPGMGCTHVEISAPWPDGTFEHK